MDEDIPGKMGSRKGMSWNTVTVFHLVTWIWM